MRAKASAKRTRSGRDCRACLTLLACFAFVFARLKNAKNNVCSAGWVFVKLKLVSTQMRWLRLLKGKLEKKVKKERISEINFCSTLSVIKTWLPPSFRSMGKSSATGNHLLHYIFKFRYNAHSDIGWKSVLYESIKHGTKAVAPPANSLFWKLESNAWGN